MADTTPQADHDLTPSLEEYLKAIHSIQTEKGYARVTDIADLVGVAKPAVSTALKHLIPLGLIEHRSYEGVRLTEGGIDRAKGISGKFAICFWFLTQILGVDEEQALRDAGNMEHYTSGVAIDRLVDLIRFFEAPDQTGLLEQFQAFRRPCESVDTCTECDFHCDYIIEENN